MHDKRAGAVGRARYLRKNGTSAEGRVWRWLRDRKLSSWKFRRQYPIGTYILDFYCNALRLAIELDGTGHVPSLDRLRSARLRRYGIKVIRLSNEDVVVNPEGVWELIARVIEVRAELVRRRNAVEPVCPDNDS
jgi:very-short-patch-repair endonuclease